MGKRLLTYSAANRLATYNGQAVEFDADGNMVSGPLSGEMANFSFDSRNRLVSAGETSYRYDAENQRIGVNQTRYVINSQPALSQVLVKEEKGVKTFYVYGLGLLGEEKEGEYRAYHFDFRGSTVALTNNHGKVMQRFQYGPYGELVKGEALVTPFLFNGKFGVMTDGNGLYYMRARFYSAAMKRFVNQDVLLGNVWEGQTLNRYAYGIGNHINRIDPTGYFAWVIPFIPPIAEGIAATTEAMIVVGGTVIVTSISGDTPRANTNSTDLTLEKASAQEREIIRVRHHTSPESLARISMICTINPSRTGGVDVELPPFGTVRLYRSDSPKRRFGCAGEGAYALS